MNRTLAAIAVCAAVAALVFAITQVASVDGSGVRVGIPDADASCVDKSPNCLTTIPMVDDNGDVWDSKTMANKIVILNVWATWCVPCKVEIPAFSRFYDKHKGEVIMLGLLSEYGVNKEQLDAFREENQMTYPVVFLEPEVREALGNPSGLPSTFFYDNNGKLSFLHTGGLTEAQLEEQLEKLIE